MRKSDLNLGGFDLYEKMDNSSAVVPLIKSNAYSLNRIRIYHWQFFMHQSHCIDASYVKEADGMLTKLLR